MISSKNTKVLLFFLVLILISIPLFQDLGFLTIRNWDESRNIINAYEMYKSGNWLIPHYQNEPDMWNTKPPLLFWLQVIFMKILGVSELAFRLPSAIAAFLTCIILFSFIKKHLNNIFIATFSVIALICSTGYVRVHVTRSGDFDALLILFTTASALCFFLALYSKKIKYIYLFYLCLTLAVLTKGIAGLLFLPAYFLYSLFSNNLKYILTNKHFYIGFLILLLFGIGYYPLRELYNPGYLNAIFNNELGGRFQGGLDGNDKRPFEFYLKNIIDKDFKNYLLPFLLGIILTSISKDKRIKQVTLFSTLIIFSYLLIISSSKTKLSWYDSPVYPFMSVVVGCGIFLIVELIKEIFKKETLNQSDLFSFKHFNKVIYSLVIFGFIIIPYFKIIKKTSIKEEPEWSRHEYKMTYFLRDAINGKHDLKQIDNTFIVLSKDGGIKQPIEFYQTILKDKGVDITIKAKERLKPGDIIFAYQDEAKAYLKENYEYKIYTEYKDNINYMFLKKYEILKKKEK